MQSDYTIVATFSNVYWNETSTDNSLLTFCCTKRYFWAAKENRAHYHTTFFRPMITIGHVPYLQNVLDHVFCCSTENMCGIVELLRNKRAGVTGKQLFIACCCNEYVFHKVKSRV